MNDETTPRLSDKEGYLLPFKTVRFEYGNKSQRFMVGPDKDICKVIDEDGKPQKFLSLLSEESIE